MRILMNNFYLIIGKSMRNMNKIINKTLSKQNIKDINKNENDNFKGEIALWKAVILQALIDLQSQSKKKIATTYRIKALMWFNLKNQDFITVCHFAGLNPYYVYEKAQIIKNRNKFLL